MFISKPSFIIILKFNQKFKNMQQGSLNSAPNGISGNVRKSALIRENGRTRLLETLHHGSDTRILFSVKTRLNHRCPSMTVIENSKHQP